MAKEKICPHCGEEMRRSPVTLHALAKSRRRVTRDRMTFSATAATLAAKGVPMAARGGAVAGARTSVAGGSASMTDRSASMAARGMSVVGGMLSPGETRRAVMYRERSMVDVWPPLVWALVSGSLAGTVALALTLMLNWSGWTPLAFWLGGTSVAWFIASRDFLMDDRLIVSEQEVTRLQPPEPVTVNPPAVNLEFNERNERGAIVHQVRAMIKAPECDPGGMARYCRAILAGTAFPSWEGGDSGPGANNFGYTETEFNAWRVEAIRAGLLESKGKQQGYKLTDRGKIAFERIGKLNLEEASYGI